MATEVVFLPIEQLAPHPDNPRRFYRPEEIEALARSIREMGGVEQALIIVPNGRLAATSGAPGVPGDRPHFLVVDGNYRLAAARSLEAPPLLKCEIRRELSRRDILLTMARTSTLWFAKDPISEARHYRKLIDEEGLTRLQIVRQLGHSQGYLAGRLRLLDLDPEIQELVAEGQLTKDSRIVDGLLSIEDPEARKGLARELAKRQATLKGSLAACARLRESLATAAKDRRVQSARQQGRMPSIVLAQEMLGGDLPHGDATATAGSLRPSVRAVCQTCDIREQAFPHLEEPAWSLLRHAADETCRACSLVEVRSACTGCPLPEMLARLARGPAGDSPGPRETQGRRRNG